MTDYSVFDKFLQTETWHKGHDYDLERFYRALKEVIRDEDFNPEAMGNYFREKKKANEEGHPYWETIADYVSKAWAVRDYKKMTGD